MPNPKLSFSARVRSWAYWVYLVSITAFAFFWVMVGWVLFGWWLDRKRYGLMWIMRLWSRLVIWGNPLYRVHVEGLENLQRGRTYVIASNHQSYADIFVLGYLPLPYVYLSKAEIFRIPFAGWGMWMIGCIPLRRGDKNSARNAITMSVRKLRQDVSVLIFPEGTRSVDGSLGPFKDGAFRMALDSDRDILPVAIEGTRNILPKGSYTFTTRAFIRIAVLPPVTLEGRSADALPELMATTRARIDGKLAELRAMQQ